MQIRRILLVAHSKSYFFSCILIEKGINIGSMKKIVLLLTFLLFFNLHSEDGSGKRIFNRFDVWVYPPGKIIPYVGHAWIELVDEDGEAVSYELNLKGMRKNKSVKRSSTISYSWPINHKAAKKVIDEMEWRLAVKVPYNVVVNNCVHLVKIAMDAADIPHPDFNSSANVPTPACLYQYIKLLNMGDPPYLIALRYQTHKSFFTPVGTKTSLKNIKNIE
jgi:hypothetical protein